MTTFAPPHLLIRTASTLPSHQISVYYRSQLFAYVKLQCRLSGCLSEGTVSPNGVSTGVPSVVYSGVSISVYIAVPSGVPSGVPIGGA